MSLHCSKFCLARRYTHRTCTGLITYGSKAAGREKSAWNVPTSPSLKDSPCPNHPSYRLGSFASDGLDNSGNQKEKIPRDKWLSLGPQGIPDTRQTRCPTRTRTHRHRVTTDTWDEDKRRHWPGTSTHRLPTLGIASPFDLPKDPYHLLKLLLLYCSGEYIFFRSKLRIIFK